MLSHYIRVYAVILSPGQQIKCLKRSPSHVLDSAAEIHFIAIVIMQYHTPKFTSVVWIAYFIVIVEI